MATANARSDDRRVGLRLAGGGEIDVVVEDPQHRPIEVLRDVRVVNVSAGGAALITSSSVKPGSVLAVRIISAHGEGEDRVFKLRTLDCAMLDQKQQLIRCKLVAGKIPAALIYNW
jgi:hypothetical protein